MTARLDRRQGSFRIWQGFSHLFTDQIAEDRLVAANPGWFCLCNLLLHQVSYLLKLTHAFDSCCFSEYECAQISFLVSGIRALVVLKRQVLWMSACTEDAWKMGKESWFLGLFIPSRFLTIWRKSVPACWASFLWGEQSWILHKVPVGKLISIFLNEEQPLLCFMFDRCKTGRSIMLNSSLMKMYLFVCIGKVNLGFGLCGEKKVNQQLFSGLRSSCAVCQVLLQSRFFMAAFQSLVEQKW